MITALLTGFRSLASGHWLLICGLIAGAGWHYADRHAAVEAERATWQTRIADAQQIAKADHDSLQAKVDAASTTDNTALAKSMADIRAKLANLGKVYHPTNALPVGCQFDQQRQDQANKALQQ
jgi:hypothetical protein